MIEPNVSPRILLIEDEEAIATTIQDRLVAEGYAVTAESDGLRGYLRASEERFDLVLLDLMLPGKGGLDICRDLRQQGVDVPILMLTAKGQVIDKVLGLKLGADDYMTKPFDMLELVARIESVLRRTVRAVDPEHPSPAQFQFGDVVVDLRRAEVKRNGVTVSVSALELRLLSYFYNHRGELLSRDQLLDEVWGYDATPFTRTVDVHVASLRQKLEPNPSKPVFIVTVHGLGYRFDG